MDDNNSNNNHLKSKIKGNITTTEKLSERLDNLERDFYKVKEKQSVSDVTLKSYFNTLNEIRDDYNKIGNKLDVNNKETQVEIKRSNQKMYDYQIEQLEQYKKTMWTVIGGLAITIVTNFFI